MVTWLYGYTDISSPIHAYMDIWLHVSLSLCLYDYMPPTYPMLMFLSFYFLTAADDYPLLLYFSPYYFLDLTHSVFSTCWYMLLPTLCSLSSSSTFFYPLLRKLPWLSRQSDRLLTDRSLVRSQAEAPFLLFHPFWLHYKIWQKSTPPVGLEPTTARLRAARSTDWARKATDIIPTTSLFYQYYHQSTWIHDYMTIPIYHHRYMTIWIYTHQYILTYSRWLHSPTCCMLAFPAFILPICSFLFLCCYLWLPFISTYCITTYWLLLFLPFSCLPLIPFSIHSLGSFRGSVGRAIGC